MKLIYSLVMFVFIFCSCTKNKIHSPKGAIDIFTTLYLNASQGLKDVKYIHTSKINYLNNEIVEIIPNVYVPEITQNIFFIKDSSFYTIKSEKENFLLSNIIYGEEKSVFIKESGAVFYKGEVPFYRKRKDLKDTIMFDKTYKRFEIQNKYGISRYYIFMTDTILPYSFNKIIDKDYSGRLERIDSYDKKQDIFITVQMLHREKWDKEAQDIFDFNLFVKNRNKNNGTLK